MLLQVSETKSDTQEKPQTSARHLDHCRCQPGEDSLAAGSFVWPCSDECVHGCKDDQDRGQAMDPTKDDSCQCGAAVSQTSLTARPLDYINLTNTQEVGWPPERVLWYPRGSVARVRTSTSFGLRPIFWCRISRLRRLNLRFRPRCQGSQEGEASKARLTSPTANFGRVAALVRNAKLKYWACPRLGEAYKTQESDTRTKHGETSAIPQDISSCHAQLTLPAPETLTPEALCLGCSFHAAVIGVTLRCLSKQSMHPLKLPMHACKQCALL